MWSIFLLEGGKQTLQPFATTATSPSSSDDKKRSGKRTIAMDSKEGNFISRNLC